MGGKGRRRSKNTNNANPPPLLLPQHQPPSHLNPIPNAPPQFTPTLSHTNSTPPHLNPNPNPSPHLTYYNYCSEQQLEGLLLKKLNNIYNQAYVGLISYGYHRDVALKAIFTNGHAFGKMDILNNIVCNSLGFIKTGLVFDNGTYRQSQQVFTDMNKLVKHSLTVMIHLLYNVRPNLIKKDAMWCLLATNFHLATASTITLPSVTQVAETHVLDVDITLHASSGICKDPGDDATSDFSKNGPFVNNSGGVLEGDLKLLKKFNLTPSLASLLRKNVVHYAAAFRANMKVSPEQPQPLNNSTWPIKKSTQQFEWEESCMVNLVLGSFGSLSLSKQPEFEPVDPKIKNISSLVHQIKEVNKQLKERQEWAHKKVIQAANKLSQDLIELKMLRFEREEKQQAKSCKLEAEEETMKMLMDMENSLRKAGCEVDVANAAVKRLEIKNAEIRAEMEAFKLNASESDKICVEIAKKERKCLKRFTALEKQNEKIQEEIDEEKRKSLLLQQQLLNIKKAKEDMEVKWRQEVQAKELAITQVQEELRFKEEADVKLKRKQEALRQKMEIDFQLCKDDMQRLEQEISHLQMSFDSADPYNLPDVFFSGALEFERTERDTFGLMVPDSSVLPDSSEEETYYRKCLNCMLNEASIIFLPCAHLVLCANCAENDCNNVEARCLCCREHVLQRFHVYGASS